MSNHQLFVEPVNKLKPDELSLLKVLTPILNGEWWCRRWEVIWYVNKCEIAGFCNSDDMRRQCAQRYMLGKRKITPPGTRRKKQIATNKKRFLSNIPAELDLIIDSISKTPVAKQYIDGNEKALNALVGMVIKQYKAEASIIRDIIVMRLKQI